MGPSTAGSPPHSRGPLATPAKKNLVVGVVISFQDPKEVEKYTLPLLQTQKKSMFAKEIIPWCACSGPAASSQVGNRPGSKQRAPSKDEHTDNLVNSQCNPKWLPGTRTDTRYADGYTQPMDGTRLTDGT